MSVSAALISLPALALILMAGLPERIANPGVRWLRQMITLLAAMQFALAVALAVAHAVGALPVIHETLADLSGDNVIAATIRYDGLASLMLAMVSFIGWVICRYSIRYLDGEPTQGRYFCWTSFTIGAVSLMVISGNLLMFLFAWVLTSLGLHQLLLHYGHRPAAQRAAWSKFVTSRIGDAALLAAAVLIYSEFGTFDFAELFAAVGSNVGSVTPAVHVAGFLLVAGALTKSAQLPFHTWLPQTLETPTPVSALMHAGIVNAGGYLIIRTGPLLSLTPGALVALAIIGAATACLAAVVMLTQTSVKKSLAYSTIAQMGFMMLQCGLGAFSAATLHILAHSLYKSHAFLSSGSTLSQRKAALGVPPATHAVTGMKLGLLGATIVAFLGISCLILGVNPLTKPGGILLGAILCLALTHWIGQVMQTGSRPLVLRALCVAGALCLVYVASFIAVDRIIAVDSVTASRLLASHGPILGWAVAVVTLAGFGGLAFLHARLSATIPPRWISVWHVHASNSFYIESFLRRIIGPLVSS